MLFLSCETAGDFPCRSCKGVPMKNRKNKRKKHALLPAKRSYKDSLFRMLFQEPRQLLDLFNAVNGTDYQNPQDLEIVTLENAIYLNMPLRILLYAAREYQKLIKDDSLYASALLKLPTPHFIVFYNGERDMPERTVLRLSDAYEKPAEKPDLELSVTVLNINSGFNESLKETCSLMGEYMQYVEKVRHYTKTMHLDQAVSKAVDDCIQKGILAEFLTFWKSEVIAMSIFEYDEKREKKKLLQTELPISKEEAKAIFQRYPLNLVNPPFLPDQKSGLNDISRPPVFLITHIFFIRSYR